MAQRARSRADGRGSPALRWCWGAPCDCGVRLAQRSAWLVRRLPPSARQRRVCLSPIGLLLIAAAALGAAITINFMGIGTLAQNLMGIFGQFGTVISTAFAAFNQAA